jgi:hypothetical protein
MRKLVRKTHRLRVPRIPKPRHHPNARLLLEVGAGVVLFGAIFAMLGLSPIHVF